MSWQVGLYVAAVLIPLAAFTVELIGIRIFGRLNAYIATGAIGLSFLLAAVGFADYFFVEAHGVFAGHGKPVEQVVPGETGAADALTRDAPEEAAEEHHHGPLAWSASFDWVHLGGSTLAARPAAGNSRADLVVPFGFRIDNLTAIMFLMVTFIATLIHIYSMGYMHDDPRYPRFFAYLSLFCFSMLGLVASANVFMIFLFWELVGVCSYLLIGFWYEEKKNSDAANKAFIANRVGDVGMLVGLGLIWTYFGTFEIQEINRTLRDDKGHLYAASLPDGSEIAGLHDRESGKPILDEATGKPRQIPLWLLTVAGLGIFAGCVGKSAQFPLHVWLPDAMAGPTPVSALIHAATMVAAGVYLVGRFYPLFTDDVLLHIAYTGGITLFIAASIAMVQTDYKKVLAYSTVSQLGFMMLGLGVGGWAAGLFHLITHAFFKALLFLGAGSIYHSVHTYEMPVLGGLRRKMPITATTMLLATMAISGVPLFSGFYSKDAILAAAVFLVRVHPEHFLLLALPVIGAAMTAFYMFRMWFLVFAGEPRGYPADAGHDTHAHHAHAPVPDIIRGTDDHAHGHDEHAHGHDDHGHAPAPAAAAAHGHHEHHGNPYDHAHESGPLMVWPLILLAIPTVIIGWPWFILPIGEPVLEQLLAYGEPIRATDMGSAHLLAMGASILIATAGIGLGALYYAPPLPYFTRRRFEAHRTAHRFGGIYKFLVHKWYFDELYNAVLIRPTLILAREASRFDRLAIDGLVNGMAGLTLLLSRLEGLFDKLAIDSLVNLTARMVYALGDWGRGIQTGKLRNYLMFLAVALVGLFAGVFAWVRG